MTVNVDPSEVGAFYALAHVEPEFFNGLSDLERLVLPWMLDFWSRPNQFLPGGDWRACGAVCGRGYGKSFMYGREINQGVRDGRITHLGLMAPTEERVDEVQIEFLIATSPPWFKAERYRGGVRWPNGVTGLAFSPLAPGRSRSENLDFAWLTELVDWQASTRMDAFENITTATRVGDARYVWDTTSKGRNDVIKLLMDLNKADPLTYPIIRGTTFDNYMLGIKYLRDTCRKYVGRRYEEEVEGKVFLESAGALWEQAWITQNRVPVKPSRPDLRLIGLDPALSANKRSDETGIIVGSRERHLGLYHAYIEKDLSGKYKPEDWGALVVTTCREDQCAGVILERNAGGDPVIYVLRSAAKDIGHMVREIPNDSTPFPSYQPGVIYVRVVQANTDKVTRAQGPAAETKSGRVHHVSIEGDHRFDALESEQTTFEPNTGQLSPNRYDAAAYLVNELLELGVNEPQDGRAATVGAATASEALNRMLTAIAERRGRGLGI